VAYFISNSIDKPRAPHGKLLVKCAKTTKAAQQVCRVKKNKKTKTEIINKKQNQGKQNAGHVLNW